MTDTDTKRGSEMRCALHLELVDRVWTGMAIKGWTQHDLAEFAGLSDKHVSQIFTGRARGDIRTWDHLLHLVDAPFWLRPGSDTTESRR